MRSMKKKLIQRNMLKHKNKEKRRRMKLKQKRKRRKKLMEMIKKNESKKIRKKGGRRH